MTLTVGTVRQTAVALATGLLLAACRQAAPAGPSPIAVNPDGHGSASDGTTEDLNVPGPTGSSRTSRPVPKDPDPTVGEDSPSPTVSPHTSWSPTPTSSPGGPTPSPSPNLTSSTTVTPTPSPPPTAGACPDARTCKQYSLYEGRWPAGPDGTITIHYRINTEGWTPDPSGVRKAPPADDMIAMIVEAAQTWMDANPRLRLIYDGVTTEEPYDGVTGHGNNVIGWSKAYRGVGIAAARFDPNQYGPTYTGFSIVIKSTTTWSWEDCDPDNGQPCTDDPNAAADFQGVLAHEWGHVLGLDHSCQSGCDSSNDADEQTMGPGVGRSKQTLALGDILGVRELYPTEAPMPTIYWP